MHTSRSFYFHAWICQIDDMFIFTTGYKIVTLVPVIGSIHRGIRICDSAQGVLLCMGMRLQGESPKFITLQG